MKLKLVLFLALGVLTLPAAVIYQQNFESSTSLPTGFSGAGSIQTTGGLSAFGFGSNHLYNGGTTEILFTLSGLAPHTSITLTFDLALWDSVDSATDLFSVKADNVTLFEGLIGNYNEAGPGTLITDPSTGFSAPNYGQDSFYRDSARAVSFTFAHSATTLNLSWQFPNSQGAPDESFGIDNIVISSNTVENTGVPEPSTMALAGLALAALAFKKRR
jgi:hypothetical protein